MDNEYFKDKTTKNRCKMTAEGHRCVFNERQRNTNTTGQAAAADPKKTLYTGTANNCLYVLQQYKVIWQLKWNKTCRGQKFLTWDRINKYGEVNVLRRKRNPPSFKTGHCGRRNTIKHTEKSGQGLRPLSSLVYTIKNAKPSCVCDYW